MIKRRVELFASDELNYLETQMNAWLNDNPDCSVIDVKISGQGAPLELEPYFSIVYTGIIFYEKMIND